MKAIFKLLAAAAISIIVFSCAKGDGDADYGNYLIYIPQATQSGGINNQYNVPSGDRPYTYNFKVEEDRILMMLGVSRSGKGTGEGYSVDVVDNRVASESFVASSAEVGETKYAVMPESMYSFPPTVTVPDGSYSESFYVEVSKAEMTDPAYDSKVLVLTLKLANPSKYELAAQNTEVTVLLDTDAMEAYL